MTCRNPIDRAQMKNRNSQRIAIPNCNEFGHGDERAGFCSFTTHLNLENNHQSTFQDSNGSHQLSPRKCGFSTSPFAGVHPALKLFPCAQASATGESALMGHSEKACTSREHGDGVRPVYSLGLQLDLLFSASVQLQLGTLS